MPSGKLKTYRSKRDFKKTAEPSGAQKAAPSKNLRFVIQKHAATRLHYDFRLEIGDVFWSWAVTRGPSLDPADKRLAVEVEDHPLDYGDFEGTIPKGEYGGGTVMVWDRGFWLPEGDKPAAEALRDGDLKILFAGTKLKGSWVLVRMKNDRTGGGRTNWLLIKHRDEYSKSGDKDALLKKDRSVATSRTMGQISAGKGDNPEPFMLGKRAAFKPDAAHCLELGVVDAVVPEPEGGAHTDPDGAALMLREGILAALEGIESLDPERRRRERRAKYRVMGILATT